ncbi:MAG: hypothetical protein IJ619_10450 [Eubacterium sp.]|nr:hypothetical protein [Eubacterium sp.]
MASMEKCMILAAAYAAKCIPAQTVSTYKTGSWGTKEYDNEMLDKYIEYFNNAYDYFCQNSNKIH